MAPALFDRQSFSSVLDNTVACHADDVDRGGRFPREAVDALGRAGVLGLMSSTEVGGAGAGPAEAAEVVESLARVCGSTAMVVLMHYAATARGPAPRGGRGPASVHARVLRGRIAQPLLGSGRHGDGGR